MKLSSILEATLVTPHIKIDDLSQRMLDELIDDDSLDNVIVGTNRPLEQTLDWLFRHGTGKLDISVVDGLRNQTLSNMSTVDSSYDFSHVYYLCGKDIFIVVAECNFIDEIDHGEDDIQTVSTDEVIPILIKTTGSWEISRASADWKRLVKNAKVLDFTRYVNSNY